MSTFARTLWTWIALMVATASAPSTTRAEEARLTRADNGLRIVTRESFARDLVALCLYVDGGNRTETAPLSGLSHYYEHLIFRGGTSRQKELETRRVFQEIGEFGGWTSSDTTCYSFVVPAARFDEALDRFADAVLAVEVTAEKVAKEREVVISEFKMSYADSPGGWAWYRLMGEAFRVHPYGRTTIGRRDVIEGADLERFRTFYAERYVPNHMIAAVVGAIPAEVARAKVAQAFSRRVPGRATFETGEVEPAQEAPRAVVEARRSEKSHGLLGWKATTAGAPDAPAVTLLAHILGGGESARLEREVRAARGLVLDVGAWFDETRDLGLLGVSFSTLPGRELAAVSAVAAEAARLRDELVPEAELARAKRKIEADHLLAHQGVAQQANALARAALLGDPALGAADLDRIRGVSAHDLREAARRVIRPEGATVSLVIPEGGTLTAEAARASLAAGHAPSRVHDAHSTPVAATSTAHAGSVESPPTSVRRLSSGALAIVREDPSASVIALHVRFTDPIEHEPADKPGTAALAERLLLRGSTLAEVGVPSGAGTGLTRALVAARLDALGARISTGLEHDALSGTIEAPADRFGDALALLASALLRPSFAADEVEKARTEQEAEVRAALDDGFALAAREQYAALYEGTTLGRPIEGTLEAIAAVTREDLVRWHRVATDPRRAIVAVVGPIEPEEALRLLERSFPAPSTPSAATTEIPATPAARAARTDARPAHRLLERPKEQLTFRLGHVGIPPRNPDWIPLAIGIRHLASQVFFRFVYEKGVAYRAWTHLAGGRSAQPFTFEMGVTGPNFPDARRELTAALEALARDGLTPAEVAKAKRDLLARHLLGQETPLAVAAALARHESNGVGWRRADSLPALVDATTTEAVNAALRRHLRPTSLHLTAVGDLAAAGLK